MKDSFVVCILYSNVPRIGAVSYTHLGFIMDGEEILDEVMAAVMKAPNSYTKEDTVAVSYTHLDVYKRQ